MSIERTVTSIEAVLSSEKVLEAVLSQGAMIINDWVITTEEIDGGYCLIARRGSDEQRMLVYNGATGPQGPAGATGPQGEPGPKGENGAGIISITLEEV